MRSIGFMSGLKGDDQLLVWPYFETNLQLHGLYG